MANTAALQLSESDAYHGNFPAKPKSRGPVEKRLFDLIGKDNIAEGMSEDELGRLGQKALREYQVDKNSRADWEEANTEAMKIARQIVEKKNYPWPNAANIKYPLLTTASIQFAARAYPALIDGRNVVKGQIRGNDEGKPALNPETGAPLVDSESGEVLSWEVEPGAKRARAERVGRHMSYQLLEEMEGWEEDTDKLLHVAPLVGCVFRKTWYDPGMGINRSELVMAEDLVVNNSAKSLTTVPRATHLIPLYPHEIEERIRDGLYLEHEYGRPVEADGNDEEAPHTFLEQHRREDLDDDGYPEPYIVTVHEDTGQVARIVAGFDEEGITLTDDGKVRRIKPIQYFTKYPFIPSFDGSFYDTGFGMLLRPLGEAINSTINQMLDAGHLQNTGGGFIGGGLRIKGGAARFVPGEFKRVDSVGGTIRENIVPMQWPGPSQALFHLLGLLIEAGRDITSVKDVMTGDAGPANEAATRTLARIEQGMKVFSSIYKRMFRSAKSEYRKLFHLNRLYLDERKYFTLLDEPEPIGKDDYNEADMDVLPAADPNMVSDMQRMAHAEFLMQFLTDPYIEGHEARRRIFEAVGVSELDRVLVKEPKPDPKIAQEADLLEIKKKEIEIRTAKEADEIDIRKREFASNERKTLAEVAKLQSDIILNHAKAEGESDKNRIAELKVTVDAALREAELEVRANANPDT